jgi:hypothetical protein
MIDGITNKDFINLLIESDLVDKKDKELLTNSYIDLWSICNDEELFEESLQNIVDTVMEDVDLIKVKEIINKHEKD